MAFLVVLVAVIDDEGGPAPGIARGDMPEGVKAYRLYEAPAAAGIAQTVVLIDDLRGVDAVDMSRMKSARYWSVSTKAGIGISPPGQMPCS